MFCVQIYRVLDDSGIFFLLPWFLCNPMLFMIPKVANSSLHFRKPQMVPDLNIWFPGFGGLIQGQIYPGIVVYSPMFWVNLWTNSTWWQPPVGGLWSHSKQRRVAVSIRTSLWFVGWRTSGVGDDVLSGQIIATSAREPPQNPRKNSGLGIIVTCPV